MVDTVLRGSSPVRPTWSSSQPHHQSGESRGVSAARQRSNAAVLVSMRRAPARTVLLPAASRMSVNSRSEYDVCDALGAAQVRCAYILARVSAGSEATSSRTRSWRRRGLGSVQVCQTAGVICASVVTGG